MPRPSFVVALALAFCPALAGAADTAPTSTARDTLARIHDAREIVVAYSPDSPPFSSSGKDGAPEGYSIELCKRVITQLARAAFASDLKTTWRIGNVAERVAMIATGKADLDCANTSATQKRMQEVDFSSLIFIDSGGVLVKAGMSAQKFADLSGKSIGVIGGTTTEQRLSSALQVRLVNAKVTPVRDAGEGMAMLESGAIDAFASDKVKLVGLAAQSRDPKALRILPDDISYEPVAFALPRGDSTFRLEVNRALTMVYTSPELERIVTATLSRLGRPSPIAAAMYLLYSIPD